MNAHERRVLLRAQIRHYELIKKAQRTFGSLLSAYLLTIPKDEWIRANELAKKLKENSSPTTSIPIPFPISQR